jgi:hypothetical protein
MMMPHFLTLAQLDDQHTISACRHGIIHLTWGRITARFHRDEFRRLVGLLERAVDALPPAQISEGELRVTTHRDQDCEVQVGPVILLLSESRLQEFSQVAKGAIQRLDEILASGAWERDQPEDAPANILERFQRVPFSRN